MTDSRLANLTFEPTRHEPRTITMSAASARITGFDTDFPSPLPSAQVTRHYFLLIPWDAAVDAAAIGFWQGETYIGRPETTNGVGAMEFQVLQQFGPQGVQSDEVAWQPLTELVRVTDLPGRVDLVGTQQPMEPLLPVFLRVVGYTGSPATWWADVTELHVTLHLQARY